MQHLQDMKRFPAKDAAKGVIERPTIGINKHTRQSRFRSEPSMSRRPHELED